MQLRRAPAMEGGRRPEVAMPPRRSRRGHRTRMLAPVLKKLRAFFDSAMLQLFDFALRPYRSNGSL